MARSQEALDRRAAKRGRTVDEQRTLEHAQFLAAQKKESVAQQDGMLEVGAWTCRQCGNGNFASRDMCRSNTCNERRPSDCPKPSRRVRMGSGNNNNEAESNFNNKDNNKESRRRRHDVTTSKTLSWAPQAPKEVLKRNGTLRQRMADHDSTLTDAERARAQILLARDARKREKQQQKLTLLASDPEPKLAPRQITVEATKDSPTSKSAAVEDKSATSATNPPSSQNTAGLPESGSTTTMTTLAANTKARARRNKSLVLRVAAGDPGLTSDEWERYHLLVARGERRRASRSSKNDKDHTKTTQSSPSKPSSKRKRRRSKQKDDAVDAKSKVTCKSNTPIAGSSSGSANKRQQQEEIRQLEERARVMGGSARKRMRRRYQESGGVDLTKEDCKLARHLTEAHAKKARHYDVERSAMTPSDQ